MHSFMSFLWMACAFVIVGELLALVLVLVLLSLSLARACAPQTMAPLSSMQAKTRFIDNLLLPEMPDPFALPRQESATGRGPRSTADEQPPKDRSSGRL